MDEAQWKRLMETQPAPSQQTDLVDQLKRRTTFIKFKPNGKHFSRVYFLVLSEDAIHYIGSRNSSKYLACLIKDIEQIRPGFTTSTWKKCLARRKINSDQSHLAFSILYDNNRKSLDLLAENEEIRSSWIRALEFLIQRYRSHLRTHREITDQWICNLFNQADHNHSGQLSVNEIRGILLSLNIELTDEDLENYFSQANIRTQSYQDLIGLDKDEFSIFYKYISQRPELLKIICQNNGSTNEQIAATLSEYTLIHELPQINPVMNPSHHSTSFFTFRRLRKSSKHKRLSQTVRRRHSASITPENHSSTSTIERKNFMTIEQLKDFLHNIQHINALSIEDCSRLIARFEPSSEGRQCEEIGVDGLRLLLLHDEFCLFNADKTHRVYHDMTRPLTDYFIATSHNTYLQNNQVFGNCTTETYIHALRNGCRAVEMDCYDGENMEPVVYHGNTLTVPISTRDIFQAIISEAFTTSPYPLFINIENHCSYEQQAAIARQLKEIFQDHLLTKPLTENFLCLPSPEQLKYKILIRSRGTAKITTADASDAELNSKKYHPDFANLIVYTQIVSFTSVLHSKATQKCFQTVSLKESKIDDLISAESPYHLDLIGLTQQQLVRVYPGGKRQDSSNFHPPFYWTYGIQMVALNYQANDEAMCLQQGFFRDNGGCGYLLKPACLLGKDRLFDPKEKIYSKGKRLHIHLISGQNLPREKSADKDSDIIDPYVRVCTYGIECDYTEHRTPSIRNNGLNPMWDYKISMDIYCSDLCLVIFQVRDHNRYSRSSFIGQACIPFNALQLGYRHVKLQSKDGDFIHATLFVHVKIDDF